MPRPLNFIIVGGSVSGFAAAIALKESGHNVVVLEKDSQLGGEGQGIDGCARLPPNGTKIITDWGLAGAAAGKTATIGPWWIYKYYTPGGKLDTLGVQRSWPELDEAARGEYMLFRHTALIRVLHDKLDPLPLTASMSKASSSGRATVHLSAEVVAIDSEAVTVTLASGEVFTGDAIIGADGRHGVVRGLLMREEGEESSGETATGMALCSAIIPKDKVEAEGGEVAELAYEEQRLGLWLGDGRATLTYPAGGTKDLALYVYTSDNAQEPQTDSGWKEISKLPLDKVMGDCDPRLRKLASLAGPAVCVPMTTAHQLESWVSESGKVLVIGEAAHPAPVAGLYLYTTALEDGLFIGKVFSHTRDPERISEFFHAFQEAREPRCARLRQMDEDLITTQSFPDGEFQVLRDAGMRANTAAGRNAMEGDLQEMLDDFVFAFGYDADDDADEWWINWGRLKGGPHASAAGASLSNGAGAMDFAKMFAGSMSFTQTH
ncbi:FAD-binding-3 domain-containing protein [Mycena kentingensis (nom. inval.)]|nr:FAD-binding-3 domain-containing protein [Mycena kentingensis (nom. inval.)]